MKRVILDNQDADNYIDNNGHNNSITPQQVKQIADMATQVASLTKAVNQVVKDLGTQQQLIGNLKNQVATLQHTQQNISNRITDAVPQENKILQKEFLDLSAKITSLTDKYNAIAAKDGDETIQKEISDLKSKLREFEINVANVVPPNINGGQIGINVAKGGA